MHIAGPAKVLQVFLGETDRWKGKPMYAAVVELAKEQGLAGATVTRGIMGFGADSRIHTASILRLSEDLPIVVTIVDGTERIANFLPTLTSIVDAGLIVTWEADVHYYQPSTNAIPGLGSVD